MAKTNDLIQMEGINSRGFGTIPKLVMQDTRLTIEAKAIYAYFSSFCGGGITAYPSRKKILSDLGISKDRFYSHFKLLLEYGYISVKRENKPCPGNIYTLAQSVMCPDNKDTLNFSCPENKDISCPENKDISCPENKDTNINKIIETINKDRLDLTIHTLTTEKTDEKELVKSSQVKSSNDRNFIVEESEPKNSDKKEKKKSRDEVAAEVKEQIQYDWLKERLQTPILDEVLNVLINGLCSEKEYCKISGEQVPLSTVKARYLERDVNDIEGLVRDIMAKTTPIKYPPAYIAAALYRYDDGEYTKFTTQYNADRQQGKV